MTEEEKKAKILAIQAPSTRAALERPVDQDLVWFLRPIPKDAQCRDERGEIFINNRPLTYEETKIEQGIRYNRGAILATMRKESLPSSVEIQKKNRAIDAFMLIKVKFKDLMKRCGLASDEEIVKYEWTHRNEN